jgi:Fe-S-cluster containining protein
MTLCTQCAALGKTCCQGTDIYVTPGDLRRIAARTGRIDFYEFRPPSDSAYADSDDDPVWKNHVFRPDGARRVVRRDPTGNCLFLESDGCRLAMDDRPLICRLHPYGYDDRGLYDDPMAGCPVHLLPSGESLGAALGLNRTVANFWHLQLYSELREENAHHDDWTNLRSAV